jgi:hypothetical protein
MNFWKQTATDKCERSRYISTIAQRANKRDHTRSIHREYLFGSWFKRGATGETIRSYREASRRQSFRCLKRYRNSWLDIWRKTTSDQLYDARREKSIRRKDLPAFKEKEAYDLKQMQAYDLVVKELRDQDRAVGEPQSRYFSLGARGRFDTGMWTNYSIIINWKKKTSDTKRKEVQSSHDIPSFGLFEPQLGDSVADLDFFCDFFEFVQRQVKKIPTWCRHAVRDKINWWSARHE